MSKPFTHYFIASIVLSSLFLGCNGNNQSPTEASPAAPLATTNVPLRMWLVGNVSNPSLIERAWLTGSDQPLEIRVLSTDEYLAEKANNCDVAVFPARLLGELADRKWITKLPSSLTMVDENTPQVPAIWQRQVTYGRDVWAVPLGASVPLAIVNLPAVELAANAEDWESLIKSLDIDDAQPVRKIDLAVVDRAALVDRYLAIVGGLTQRTPNYGLLFELQTMKPRLSEPEFIRAAEILLSLTQQRSDAPADSIGSQASRPHVLNLTQQEADLSADSIGSVIGSSSTAWTWLHGHKLPALAIVATSQLSASDSKETGCKALRIPKQWIGWNTGGGLIAALSANCRQSARTTELLRWLRQSETRQTLATIVTGIESASPLASSDSSAWQAHSVASALSANNGMPCELRLPRAEDYRHALANSLIAILSREKSVPVSLGEAANAWQSITDARGRVLQRSDYELSLGLSRD